MSGILFDFESAKRIANATRGWEREQGAEPPIGYQPNDYGRLMMVQTGTLPSGYTGAMAVHGNVIEKTPAGLIRVIAPIWIKDLNNGALAANTIYYGRIGGSLTQDYTVNGVTTPTTLGLYLVQVGSGGGAASGAYEPFRVAGIVNGNLLGLATDNTRTQVFETPTALGPQFNLVYNRLGVQVTGSGIFGASGSVSNKFIINPFTFQADCHYYASTQYGDVVMCGNPMYPWSYPEFYFDAFDPQQIVRGQSAYIARAILSWGTTVAGLSSRNPFIVLSAHYVDKYIATAGLGAGFGTGI